MMKNSGDGLVECPYDSTHMLEERTLGKHLIKCRENHKGHKKVVCLFDKTHLVPKPELQHHHSVCPSRYLLDREMQLKASKDVENVLTGDVKGPEIVTKYVDDDDDDETWDSVPSSKAPVALFNRKHNNFYEDDESAIPRMPPGASYQSKPKNVPNKSDDNIRETPSTLSKAAQISEMSSRASQPSKCNQVYNFSLFQSANAGWGRGRGINSQQAPQNVGSAQSHRFLEHRDF